LSLISPLTLRVPLSVVTQAPLAVVLQAVQLAPLSQLKRYVKPAVVSAEDGSLAAVSESAIEEPSFTVAGALKVAVGATLSTVTEAEYSGLVLFSSSFTWPLTVLVPLSVVAQVWVVAAPQAVQVVPSQLKRYWCESAPGSATSESERLMFAPSFTDAGALNVAEGATLFTVTVAEYSTLSPPSSSLTWPVTTRLPLSLVVQLWLVPAP
jgi:hypothetical protein